MRVISETAAIDLSGTTLFPGSSGISDILSDPDYLVSELRAGTTTQAYLQASSHFSFDYDTFVATLDPGDTYQIRLTVDDPSHFMSNRGIARYDADGSYGGLILNDYGDAFDANNSLLTDSFSLAGGGEALFITKIREASTVGSHGYTLDLIKTIDVEPWSFELSQFGNGGRATLSVGDMEVTANTMVTIYVTISHPNMTVGPTSLLTNGSISTYSSTVGSTTTLTIYATPSNTVELDDLLAISFAGGEAAGSVEITSVSVRIGTSYAPIETSGTLATPGDITLNGSNNSDLLQGDVGNDTLRGNGGDDTLSGALGNDDLIGGRGRDTILGGSGNDSLFGNGGHDFLFGQGGDDDLFGGGGRDTLKGNQGSDRLTGGRADDWLSGGSGSDRVLGGGGSDTILGGAGRDVLWGQNGNDTLRGNAGADFLSGGKGNDLLAGGAGRDRFEFTEGSGADTIKDFQNDRDTLFLSSEFWDGGASKRRVLEQYGSVQNDAFVLDFGQDQLVIAGVTDPSLLLNDLQFL